MSWLIENLNTLVTGLVGIAGIGGTIAATAISSRAQDRREDQAFKRQLLLEKQRKLGEAAVESGRLIAELATLKSKDFSNKTIESTVVSAFSLLAPWVANWSAVRQERDAIIADLQHHGKRSYSLQPVLSTSEEIEKAKTERASPHIYSPLTYVHDFFSNLAAEPEAESDHLATLERQFKMHALLKLHAEEDNQT